MAVEEWKRKNPPIQRKPVTAEFLQEVYEKGLTTFKLYKYKDGYLIDVRKPLGEGNE